MYHASFLPSRIGGRPVLFLHRWADAFADSSLVHSSSTGPIRLSSTADMAIALADTSERSSGSIRWVSMCCLAGRTTGHPSQAVEDELSGNDADDDRGQSRSQSNETSGRMGSAGGPSLG